jgi:phage shock protein E
MEERQRVSRREPSARRAALTFGTRRPPAVTLDPTTLTLVAVAGAFLLAKLLLGRRVPSEVVAGKLRDGATVVDVRTPAEFRTGAYRGAINVPLQELSAKLGRIPKDRPVVVYCASGSRSAWAARILRRAGHADVSNAGGLRHMP